MSKRTGHEGHTDEVPATAPAQSLTIQGHVFTAPAPYAEGHPLSAEEAKALNSLLGENLRNNFSTKVTKAKEALTEGQELDLGALQTEFDAYAASYQFHAKRAPKPALDPVAKEAHKIAKDIIMAKVREKNISTKDWPEGKMDDLITSLLEKNPAIREEAQRRIDNAKAAASLALDGLEG